MSARGGGAGVQRVARENGRHDVRPAALGVRLARQSDLVPLSFFFDAVLRRDYFLRRGQLEDIFRGPRHELYVAEIDSVLVGAAIMTRGSRLINVLVHPAYRGLGIGRELVEQTGASEVRAKLDMSTGDPRGFYRSLGFASTGSRNKAGNIELLRLSNAAKTRASRQRSRRVRRSSGKGNGNGAVSRSQASFRK